MVSAARFRQSMYPLGEERGGKGKGKGRKGKGKRREKRRGGKWRTERQGRGGGEVRGR